MENETPEYFQERDALGLEKPKIKVESFGPIETVLPIELNVTYATLGSRIMAYLLDALILLIPLMFLEFMIWGEDFIDPQYSLLRNLLNFAAWTLYYGQTESSDSQATFGKRICGLKVIDENGNKLTFKKAALRYIAQIISIIPLGFGIWAIAKDEKKQGWHDMLLGCYVIQSKSTPN